MQKSHIPAERKGFTLIELLIVIGIIGFLAAAVLVAVDPVKRIQSSRDSQRWSEVDATLNAILKWQVDNLTDFEGEASVAQTFTATLSGGGAGTYELTLNGVTSGTVAATGTVNTDAASLAALIDGNTFGGDVLNATSSGAVVTIVADQAGNDFTAVDASTTVTIAVVQTVANDLNAPIDDDAASVQVIVSDHAGVLCITGGGASPACPAADPALITATTLETECVANIVGLVPEYLSEIPIDPNDGTTPTAGFEEIGATNTGYYINKNASGRITVGSCYPEQETNIRVQR